MDGAQAASTLAWWREAGVDTLVGETPRNWLESNRRTAAIVADALAPLPALSPEGERELLPPATLPEFQAWLLSGDFPGAAPAAARVGPAGDPGSGVMVMTDMPSAEDLAAGHLLAGEAGALFDRMLGAIGLDRSTLYLASLSPVRSATGSLGADAAEQLADIARHHVGLVRPRALLLFGDACARALLGGPVAQTRGKWHELATPAGKFSTLVTIRPEKLVRQPGLKKHAWEDLQLLREGLKS